MRIPGARYGGGTLPSPGVPLAMHRSVPDPLGRYGFPEPKEAGRPAIRPGAPLHHLSVGGPWSNPRSTVGCFPSGSPWTRALARTRGGPIVPDSNPWDGRRVNSA